MNKNNNITNVLIDTFYLTADEFIKTKNDAYLFSATEFLFQIMVLVLNLNMPKKYLKYFSVYIKKQSIRVRVLAWLFAKKSLITITVLYMLKVKLVRARSLLFTFQ